MITYSQLMEKRVGRGGMSPTPDDPTKKALRAPGDVGKLERLQQVDKDASPMVSIPDTAQRMGSSGPLQAKADEILQDMGVDTTKVGTVSTPRDYTNPYQYARRVSDFARDLNGERSDRGFVDDPADAEIDPRYDRDASGPAVENPGPPPRGYSPTLRRPQDREYKAKLDAYQAAQAGGAYMGGNDDTAERMAGSDLAGRDMVTAADKSFDDAIATAQGPTMRDPVTIDTKGGPITKLDSPELAHGFQGSGIGVMKKKAFDMEYADALVGAIVDPDLASSSKEDSLLGIRDDLRTKNSPAVIKNKDGGDIGLEIKDPTRRDIEAMSDEGELRGEEEGRAYLTPEVKKQQQAMRDALKGQQSEKVQELAFKFQEISDLDLNNFIERFGAARGQRGKEGKMRLVAELESRGGVDGERSVIWGGDIEVPEEARYDNDGKKLPEGSVNMAKIQDNDLKAQIRAQRAMEMIRTYLKQGGINAYAMHEGFRSPLDMDLEHIKSLKAGGFDNPNNWVWASSNLNQLRGDEDLGPFVDSRVSKSGTTGPSSGNKLGGTTQYTPRKELQKTYNAFVDENPENKEKLDAFHQEFGDPTAARLANRGIFAPDEYEKLSPEDIEDLRDGARKHFGFNDNMINQWFPTQGRLKGTPMGELGVGTTDDYERVDTDSTTNMRDQVLYRNFKKDIKKLNPLMSDADLKKAVYDKFKDLGASEVRDAPQAPEADSFDLDV